MNSKNTGLYMIACVGEKIIYAHHDKVYSTKGKAESALKRMLENGYGKVKGEGWKVMSIVDLREVE